MNKIFVFIAITIVVAIALSGCSYRNDYDRNRLNGLCNFSKLGNISDFGGYHHSLYYDTTTGVIYMLTYGLNVNSWTPLFNADGTLKVWQERDEAK